MTVNVYQVVTNQILAKLEQGTVPWQKPWKGGQRPTNLVSGKAYRGINVLLLGTTGFTSPYWLTYKQATDLGGHVRKGEKSTLVVFWQMLRVKDKETGDPKTIPMLRYYRVFNLEQTEDVRVPKGRVTAEPQAEISPIEAAEQIIASYPNPPKIQEAGDEAWYREDTDLVNLPPRELFTTADEFYVTAFHELGHSTGHKDRLDRPDSAGNRFGDHKYGREELVAEMTAAFLATDAGIDTTRDNNAAYVAGWVQTIRADIKAVVVAAGQAQKAADWVQGRTPAEDAEQAAA